MEYLKMARSESGATINAMAEVAGVERKTYMNWESGKTSPTAVQLIRMAAYLNKSISYLCGEQNEECHFLSQLDCITVEEAREICEIFDLLAWKDRNDMIERLDKLRLVAWAIGREKHEAIGRTDKAME